jgi:hypothetical protein
MAAGPQDAPRHAGQVVRRVLLRRTTAFRKWSPNRRRAFP